MINSEDIQNEIDYVQVQEWVNETVKVNITQNDRKTNKINIESEDIVFNIEKEETENAVAYKLSVSNAANGEEIGLIINLSGLNTNAVAESYEMNVKYENEYDITYAYENTVSFGNVDIEPITTANAAILNNYSAQQIISLITQVGARIAQINTEQMTAIGYNMQYGNPLLTWIVTPSHISTISLLDSVEQTQQEYEDALQEEQEQVDEIESYVNNMIADQNTETTVDPNDYRPSNIPETSIGL